MHASVCNPDAGPGCQNRRKRFRALAPLASPGASEPVGWDRSGNDSPIASTPRRVAKLIREGILENARFAAAVLVRGVKDDQPLLIRWDASFPTLYQIRGRGLTSTPIAYATAHLPRFSSNISRAIPRA